MNADCRVRPRRRSKQSMTCVLGAVLLLASLSACAPPNDVHAEAKEAKSMTPEEARSEIEDLYRATRDALGGVWKVGREDWSDCTTASGDSGATFNLHVQRLDQPLGMSAADATRAIQKIWYERHIEASMWLDSSAEPAMHYLSFPDFGAGTAPDGYLVQFAAADVGYADVSGTSHCAVGDAYELDMADPSSTPEGTAP